MFMVEFLVSYFVISVGVVDQFEFLYVFMKRFGEGLEGMINRIFILDKLFSQNFCLWFD